MYVLGEASVQRMPMLPGVTTGTSTRNCHGVQCQCDGLRLGYFHVRLVLVQRQMVEDDQNPLSRAPIERCPTFTTQRFRVYVLYCFHRLLFLVLHMLGVLFGVRSSERWLSGATNLKTRAYDVQVTKVTRET